MVIPNLTSCHIFGKVKIKLHGKPTLTYYNQKLSNFLTIKGMSNGMLSEDSEKLGCFYQWIL
jgi:hypothetical protein